jgi:hypothetical protein
MQVFEYLYCDKNVIISDKKAVISIKEYKKSSVVQKVDNKGFDKDLQGLVKSGFLV